MQKPPIFMKIHQRIYPSLDCPVSSVYAYSWRPEKIYTPEKAPWSPSSQKVASMCRKGVWIDWNAFQNQCVSLCGQWIESFTGIRWGSEWTGGLGPRRVEGSRNSRLVIRKNTHVTLGRVDMWLVLVLLLGWSFASLHCGHSRGTSPASCITAGSYNQLLWLTAFIFISHWISSTFGIKLRGRAKPDGLRTFKINACILFYILRSVPQHAFWYSMKH